MDVNKSVLARPTQLLEDHLKGVGTKASLLLEKINMPELGHLLGLLHDLGKYSDSFQHYLASALGKINPDGENYIDYKTQKGKIDHATAGAQWVWKELSRYGGRGEGRLCGQILALCIGSHHSGLIDCLKPEENQPESVNSFKKRMEKPDDKTHLLESLNKIDPIILDKITSLANKDLVRKMIDKIKDITKQKSSRVKH